MTNPFVPILQRLNSSSPRGNDKCINHQPELFVETYLHTFLSDEILSAKYKLVFITGCSGDGKTEFIQWLETERMGEKLELAEKPVGRYDWIEYGDILFSTLYDAEMTFEQEKQGPEELLHDNLDDFSGEEWNEPQCYRLFSINRDHLRRFLEENKDKYTKLHRIISPALSEVNPDPSLCAKEGILVVDLTFRSLVGDILREEGLEEGCIFTRLVEKLCSDEYWKACSSCDAEAYCPIRYNIKALDPRNGKPVAARLKQFLTAFHYRRIFHMTMRDMVSLLVHSFVTDIPCENIIREGAYSEFIFPLFYFNRLFSLPEVLGTLIDEIDIAAVNAPRVDAKLFSSEDLINDVTNLPNMVIKDILDSLQFEEIPAIQRDRKKAIRKARKRRIYFEDLSENSNLAMELFPYRSFQIFDDVAKKKTLTSDLLPLFLNSISLRDGLSLDEKGYFIFTLDSNFEQIVTYYRAPIDDFELILPLPKAIAGHREYLPGYLLLRHKKNFDISLRINLDILEYILYGSFNLPEKPDYLPELKHRMRIFKEKLEEQLELSSFLIRAEDGVVAEISRSGIAGGEITIIRERNK